jgi:alkaline phosphatase D
VTAGRRGVGVGVGVINRRSFLRAATGAAAAASLSRRLLPGAPSVIAGLTGRPEVGWGLAVGDVTDGRATVWSRTDRPARMIVEYAAGSAAGRRAPEAPTLADTDFTARTELTGLPPAAEVRLRVRFEDGSGLAGPAAEGRFRTPPAAGGDVHFAWSADTVGQGWGIDPEWGGLRIFESIRRLRPDFFVHCGDVIYADNPLKPVVTLDDGSVWRNLVTPAKSKVAESLEEFRGNYQYNLLDSHLRAFLAEVPVVAIWDDHETVNNWYPGEVLDDPRYVERSASRLAARARRAFLEYLPVRRDPGSPDRLHRALSYGPALEVFVLDQRSYRGPNSENRQPKPGPGTALLGRGQLGWLKKRLAASTATWKAIVTGMPLGVVVRDGAPAFENAANGEGPPLGRELETADLLRFLRRQRIRNVVWLTGDVHYAAAHHFHPDRATFRDFDPFWEFVAGPLHAGTFGPNPVDPTFGPEVRFVSVPSGMRPNRPPKEGLQFFGTVRIDGRSRVMTVALHDLEGRRLFHVDVEPQGY